MQRVTVACLCLSILVLVAGNAWSAESKGRQVSSFVLNDSNGNPYDVAKHVGKDVMIVAFWATWCKPCKIELSALHKLYLKYKDSGLAVLALSIDGPESIAAVANYKKTYGYKFPVLMDSETAVLEQYNPRGDVPFSMVVDRSGAIVAVHQGYNPGDEIPLEKKLKKLLAKKVDLVPTAKGSAQIRRASFSVTESLQLRYLIDNYNDNDNDDNVFGISNKLTVSGTVDDVTVGTRFDNTMYPFYDKKDPWLDDHRIERVWAQYKTRPLELRLGDYYHSLGRGLVFSVRKIAELGVDAAIRGGRARGRVGPVTIQGFGGKSNVQNTDLDVVGPMPDPNDTLAGGEVSVELPANITVAARGLYVDYEDAGETFDYGDWTAGGSVEMRNIADVATIYFEGAYLENQQTFKKNGDERGKEGYGMYASIALTPMKGLSILLEGKDYHRFEMKKPGNDEILPPILYHEPPTLERLDQISPATRNATGGRILVEYYQEAIKALYYVNFLYYGFFDGDVDLENKADIIDNFDPKYASKVMHAYGGVEKRFKGGVYVNISGGFRVEPHNTPRAHGDFRRRLWHAESDIQVPLSGKHAIGLRTNHRSEEKPVNKKEFIRGDAALTYSYAPQLSLGLLWGYQTEGDGGSEFLNFAGEGVWRFSDWGQFNILGGRITGGLICVSGVCRQFPPFYGVKSEFIARF